MAQKPSISLNRIKQRAKAIKREQAELLLTTAQDIAAREFGFHNFIHAEKELARLPAEVFEWLDLPKIGLRIERRPDALTFVIQTEAGRAFLEDVVTCEMHNVFHPTQYSSRTLARLQHGARWNLPYRIRDDRNNFHEMFETFVEYAKETPDYKLGRQIYDLLSEWRRRT